MPLSKASSAISTLHQVILHFELLPTDTHPLAESMMSQIICRMSTDESDALYFRAISKWTESILNALPVNASKAKKEKIRKAISQDSYTTLYSKYRKTELN